jgi:ADP-heptose:LPS heptosyltransferase
MKILLIRNDNIGDLVCTTPVIEALKKKYPDAKIDIVVNSYNYVAIDKNPFVNTIYCYTKPKHKKNTLDKIKALLGKIKIMFKIFANKYDVSVVFRSGYSSSAEQFSNLSGAKMRIGVKDKNNKDNFTHHIDVNRDNHEVEFCFDCLKPLGVEYGGENLFFYVPDDLKNRYKQYKNNILFHISSRIKENKYSKEKFKTIIDNIDANILISAEPVDFESAKWLEENTKAKWIKTDSLIDLAGLISNVKLFVTLDGGAMHIAPALGIKTIAISGKTNMNKWYPWGYKDLVIQDKTKIAENIEVEKIIEKIKDNI